MGIRRNSYRAATVRERGSALLAVLWLSAVLSAIALTVSTSIRAETERTSTAVDGLRAYYLAAGSIDRGLLWIQWGSQYRNPDGTPRYFTAPMPVMHFEYPTGAADVEVIPESSKLDLNKATPQQLMAILASIDAPGDRAQTIVQGIIDWRSPSPGGSFTDFDQHYLSISPTFRARHASFEEIEELLLVRGMTPEIFYGRYDQAPDGHLLPRPGLKDCVSLYSAPGVYDINTVQPAVMQALGVPPDAIAQIVAMRQKGPIRSQQLSDLLPRLGAAGGQLGLGSSSVITLRATAAAKLANGRMSDLRRSVSALIAFVGEQYTPSYHILRWYDNAVVLR
jgi:general secretion pathway protein K